MSIKGKLKDIKRQIKKDPKKFILMILPYMAVAYAFNKISYAYRITDGDEVLPRLMTALSDLGKAFKNPLPSIHPKDFLIGAAAGIALFGIVYYKSKNKKKFRKGEEYGSATWGKEKDIEPYMDPDNPENNILITQTEGLMLSGRPSSPKYARNKNIEIIGGSGSGKTRFFIKPNIMQMHSSYAITDPKGYFWIGQ